jgi:hypothetical protein
MTIRADRHFVNKTQGQRRQKWERLRQRRMTIQTQTKRLFTDLASYNDNHPDQPPIAILPMPALPELPPPPAWNE